MNNRLMGLSVPFAVDAHPEMTFPLSFEGPHQGWGIKLRVGGGQTSSLGKEAIKKGKYKISAQGFIGGSNCFT